MQLSIITPTIDSAGFIDEAVTSVPRWERVEIEHIIVHDGGDAFPTSLKTRHPHLRILKGTNAGPGGAAALGIEVATGDFIFHLNSDDRLVPGALERLLIRASEEPTVRIWTGGTRIFRVDADGREVTLRHLISPEVTALSLANLFDDVPLLTARFCHRSVYAEIGNLDMHFPHSNDREFLIRAALSGIKEASLDTIVSELRQHEGSQTMNCRRRWVPSYLADNPQIADMWLDRPGLPAATKTAFRNWRAREVLRLIVYQLRSGQWDAAASSFTRDAALDPLWYFRAFSALAAWRRRRRT